MDMIVGLIDQLIEQRIKAATSADGWNDYKHDIAVTKEKLRRVLDENVSTGSESSDDLSRRVIGIVKDAQRARKL